MTNSIHQVTLVSDIAMLHNQKNITSIIDINHGDCWKK